MGSISRLAPTSLKHSSPCLAGTQSIKELDGGAYVLDTRKAPFWTIADGLAFVASAQAARKTTVFGTISDYAGKGGARYRRVARQALEVAERVIFVGPNSAHVDKMRQGELRERLFTFQTAYQATTFLSKERLPGELTYVKASGTDHLERLMLAELDRIVCWRERCGRSGACPDCAKYRFPKPPPFGLDRPAIDEDAERDSRKLNLATTARPWHDPDRWPDARYVIGGESVDSDQYH